MMRGTATRMGSEGIQAAMSSGTRVPGGYRTEQTKDFEALYCRYYRRVFLWCQGVVRNPHDAEDLTQDAFIHVMSKIHTFRGEASFSTWLFRVVMNIVFMQLRRKHVPQTPLDEILEANDGAINPRSEVRRMNQTVAVLNAGVDLSRAIDSLPRGFRVALLLHDGENYTHSEIAEFMGWSPGTSKSQLHKARRRLRELLV